MTRYLLDTNLYIGAMRQADRMRELVRFVDVYRTAVFQHSVIAQEIVAGARDGAGYRQLHRSWVQPFELVDRIITPGHETWMRAAYLIARLTEAGRLSPGGVARGFRNDCLLAASAREHAFTIVTNNLRDFRLIATVETKLRIAAPWPK